MYLNNETDVFKNVNFVITVNFIYVFFIIQGICRSLNDSQVVSIICIPV